MKHFLVVLAFLTLLNSPSSFGDDTLSGVYDFRILDSKTLLFSNPFRANSKLKITFKGANFTHVEHRKAWNSWELVNSGLNASLPSPAVNTIRINNQTLYAANRTYYTFNWDHHLHNLHSGLTFPDQEICFEIKDSDNATSWYSTSLEKNQPWPFNHGAASKSGPQPLQSGSYQGAHPYGPVTEKVFISTSGFALHLGQQSFPTIIVKEDGGQQLCSTVRQFKSERENPTHYLDASFELVATMDIVKLHKSLLNTYHLISVPYFPGAIPSELMFNRTLVNLNVKILKQAEVIEKVTALNKSGLKNIQVVLDGWEAHVGDFVFDKARFPDPKTMIAAIHKLGFLVKLTVQSGLASTSSASFKAHPTYFLTTEKDHKKVFTFASTLLNDTVAVFDWAGNYAVRNWIVDHMRALAKSHEILVDSFRFVGADTQFGGEEKLANSTLESSIFKHNWYGSDHYSNVFTQRIVYMADMLHEHGGSLVEIDAAYETQFFPLFIRLRDIPAEWASLASVIPQALTLGLAGYSFPVPPIFSSAKVPTEELYIRWLQLCTFFPSMQLSPAISVSQKAANLTNTFLALHQEHAQTLVALAKAATKAGELLMRPMWYLAPNDPKSYLVGDQFALGSDLIVAPVLLQGARERSVYLPTGNWNDQHGRTYTVVGPSGTVVKVLAPLEELPYFKRKM